MGIYKNIMELTGGTPLLELCNYEKKKIYCNNLAIFCIYYVGGII